MNFQRLGVAYLGALVLYVAISNTTAHRTNGRWRCAHGENIAKTQMTYKVRVPSRLETSWEEKQDEKEEEGNEFQPFRLHIEYDPSVEANLQPSARDRLERVVGRMEAFFESAVRVRPVEGRLVLQRDCTGGASYPPNEAFGVSQCVYFCENTTMCGIVTVPEDQLKGCTECINGDPDNCAIMSADGTGVQADFILYVSAFNVTECIYDELAGSNLLAFSSPCQLDEQYDRPVGGFANFCPDAVEWMASEEDEQVFLEVIEHEVFHTLVFSDFLFAWYRDENGDPRTPRDSMGYPPMDEDGNFIVSESTIREVEYPYWQTRTGPIPHTVQMLVTPRVTEEARRHFGCRKLQGLELENGGGPGTAGSHWEKRLLEWEAMTGTLTDVPVFSAMSLAVLDDSGWYRANFSAAEQLLWGQDMGCAFVKGSCGGFIEKKIRKGKSISPFCNELNDTGVSCNLQRTAGAYCDLIEHEEPIPRVYQYKYCLGEDVSTNETNIGGSSVLSDYCPHYVAYDIYECEDPDDSPGTGTNNVQAETYGPGSRCFDTTHRWTVQVVDSDEIVYGDARSGCYQYECTCDQIVVIVLGTRYTCSSAGEELSISVTYQRFYYNGTIICPAYEEICYDAWSSIQETY